MKTPLICPDQSVKI
jgi:hypothetical protein